MPVEFRGENFRGWRKNREICEFSPSKVSRYTVIVIVNVLVNLSNHVSIPVTECCITTNPSHKPQGIRNNM